LPGYALPKADELADVLAVGPGFGLSLFGG
jgi:hypothetical protein